MIYTVTLNPAIDYVVGVKDIKTGTVNRTSKEQVFFGGKGINVSRVLSELDVKSVATGFIAGFTGKALKEEMQKFGIETLFTELPDGFSRINIKIKSDEETEINGIGPTVSEEYLDKFLRSLSVLKNGDILVLAGSVPKSVPDNIYEIIMERFSGKGIKFVVDALGELLKKVLPLKPYLIKPNHIELGEIFGVEINTPETAEIYARKLQDMGAENIIVSMAEKGALLIDKNGESHFCEALKGEVINSVGAGDSMLAGFLAGIERGENSDYALKLGTASGGATAFSSDLAKKEMIEKLFEKL